jgi:hypothetical protein
VVWGDLYPPGRGEEVVSANNETQENRWKYTVQEVLFNFFELQRGQHELPSAL